MTGAIAEPMRKAPNYGAVLGGVRVATLEFVALITAIQIACGFSTGHRRRSRDRRPDRSRRHYRRRSR